jgi:molecular chaperone GrpE
VSKQNSETDNKQPEIHITDRRRIHIDYNDGADNESAESAFGSEGAAPDFVVSVPDSEAVIHELQNKLSEAEAKREEAERERNDLVDRFRKGQLQLKAENDEMRQRLQRNFEQKLEGARGEIAAGLLDVLDNLKLAISAAFVHEGKGAEFDSLLGGVRVTAQMFETRLSALGISPVTSAGEVFNPEIHEAVEMVEVDASLDGRVIDEMQTGYRFGNKLLRPARVRVGRAGGRS